MDSGNTTRLLTSSALVMFMTPGLAFFGLRVDDEFAGLDQSQHAESAYRA